MKAWGWKKEGILLLGIVLAALALRLTTYKYEYLLGIDPFHHYRIAEYLAEKGQLPVIWPLSLAPTGAAITEPAGLYYVSVLLHKLLEPFGFSFVQAFKLAPALFGAFALVPAYLLARKVFDRRAALYSSIVLAFLPAFIYRSFSGFYRGDVFSTFFMLWGFYFFLASLDGPLKRRVATSALAGLSLGLMGLVWNGFLFGFGVLTLAFLLISTVSYYRGRWSWAPLQSYILSAGLGVLLIKSFILLYPNTAAPISTLAKYIYPGTVAFSGTLGALDLALKGRGARERVVSGGLLILATALILLVIFPGFLESLSKTTSYGALGSDDPILGRISELGRPTLKRAEETGIAEVSIEEKYGVAHALAASGLPATVRGFPLGLLTAVPALVGLLSLLKVVWKERRAGLLFLFVWLFTSLYLLVSAVRFAFLDALPIAVLWGEGLMILGSWKIPDRRA
ncbi:MAG: STT3 domain-containing protein, partial [Candidatus Hydrothermarchaeota archaeon]